MNQGDEVQPLEGMVRKKGGTTMSRLITGLAVGGSLSLAMAFGWGTLDTIARGGSGVILIQADQKVNACHQPTVLDDGSCGDHEGHQGDGRGKQ